MKIQKSFFWGNSTLKIKHETLCNDSKARGLKNIDNPNKSTALHCSWIRTFYDNCFHEWSWSGCTLLKNHLALHLNFIQIYSLEVVKPSFTHLSIRKLVWTEKKKHLAMITEMLSCTLSQYLWYNGIIQADKGTIQILQFSEKNNYFLQLFSDNGSIKKWLEFKREYNLHENPNF